jgi:prepilin-type N-terminal cleavage/methylation domain-containing protein
MKNFHSKQSGFTLIEMLVSVSIFIVVALIVSLVFVSLAQANTRARNIKLLVDNVNFAMDSMVLDLKTSKSFKCVNGLDTNCLEISYDPLSPQPGRTYDYRYDAVEKAIYQGSLPLTSPQVSIDDLRFVLVNSGPGNKQQGVYIYVRASAQERTTKVEFNLQTFVSARNP